MKRILGLLGWLGVVLVLAAVLIRFTKPEWQEWSRGLAIAGLVVTALYALSQWRDIGRSFQGRNVRYGSVAAGSVLVFLGILVAVNYISNRQHKRWDLTAAQQFSLSDQTKKILGDLKKPLVVRAFYESQVQSLRDHLSEYQYASKLVSVEYVDANKEPAKAKTAGITAVPTIILDYEGRTERANQSDEQSLTNALKKVLEGKTKKIYFVQGHGEHDPTASERTGYSGLADALRNDNFEVANLNLAQEGKVPDDASVIAVAGPKTDYFPPEVDALRTFLKKGGKLLLFIDPVDKPEAAPLTTLIALAKEWGVTIGNDVVVDVSGVGRMIGAGPEVPIAMPAAGGGHPITADFRLMTAFPFARSVTPIEGGTDGHVPQKVLETSPRSWGKTDLKGLFGAKELALNADQGDKAGPVPIAVAVTGTAPDAPAPATPDAPKSEARVVIVGDSDFAANNALGIQGNKDLALNMANWAAQQDSLIAIRPHDAQDRRIQLTDDQSQRIVWIALALIPGLLLANGVRVWWRRR